MTHIPVLLKEVLKYLDPRQGQNFIDCNLGLAGHSLAILNLIGPTGEVLGIDLDKETIERFKNEIGDKDISRLHLVQGNFADLKEIRQEQKFYPVHGILFDLGFSTWQIKQSKRGFSFQNDEPLLMNYQDQNLTAEKIVNQWTEKEISKILEEYGQERFARKIAKEILIHRKHKPIKTTKQLTEIILHATPGYYHHLKIHYATKTFMALRVAVNDELNNLRKALPQALEILETGGRLVVISFHSLEDRIVKNFFSDSALDNKLTVLTKKPIIPGEKEMKNNPSSRSAKLRVAQKI